MNFILRLSETPWRVLGSKVRESYFPFSKSLWLLFGELGGRVRVLTGRTRRGDTAAEERDGLHPSQHLDNTPGEMGAAIFNFVI